MHLSPHHTVNANHAAADNDDDGCATMMVVMKTKATVVNRDGNGDGGDGVIGVGGGGGGVHATPSRWHNRDMPNVAIPA